MKSIAETADQEKVLIAARNHPKDDPTPKDVAETLEDDYLNTSYVERIMHDFALSSERIAELEGEDNEDEDENDNEDDSEDASITPEELEHRNSGTSREDDTDSDEVVLTTEDEQIDRVIEDATRKQLSALLYMAAAPHPVTHVEVANAADAAQPYIFQVTSFHENDMLAKVSVENRDGPKDRKLWVLTTPAAEALNRYVAENGAHIRDVLEELPNVTEDGEWFAETNDYVLTDEIEVDTSKLAIERTLIEPPQEDVADPEPRVYEDVTEDDKDEDEDEDETEPEGKTETADEDEDEDEPDATEALEQLAENDNDPAEAFAGNADAKLELEEISKESDEHAYECDICDDPFNTYRSAKIHVTLSEEGDHKGRNGSEPGVVRMNSDFLASLAHNSEGHNGSVSVELDPESVFVRDEDDEDEDEEHGVPVATDAADETPRNGRLDTVERGNVTIAGSFDATGGKEAGDGAKRLRQPTTIKNRRVKGTQEQRSDDEDSTDGSEPTETDTDEVSDERMVATLSLTKDEAFELIESDAPENIRRRVFDAIVER